MYPVRRVNQSWARVSLVVKAEKRQLRVHGAMEMITGLAVPCSALQSIVYVEGAPTVCNTRMVPWQSNEKAAARKISEQTAADWNMGDADAN